MNSTCGKSHPLALCLALALAPSLLAAPAPSNAEPAHLYWPQWRGPLANGVSPTAEPPLTWSESSNVLWKVRLPGRGTSTPIVWGDLVFIHSAIPTGKKAASLEASTTAPTASPEVSGTAAGDPSSGPSGGAAGAKVDEIYQFVLLALDRKTGKTVWQKVVREECPHEGHHRDHDFACYSPITDGQQVYAYLGSRGLHGYDMAGNLKWEKDLGRMRIWDGYGEGGSPALSGHTLVVNWDHEGDDFIAAFDTQTGRELWRQPREEDTSWSTPLIVEQAGSSQVVTDGTRKLRGYDLATGKLLWEYARQTIPVVTTPVAGDGLLYSVSGVRACAALALRLDRTGDLAASDGVAWRYTSRSPWVPSPLLCDGRLYAYADNKAILTCLDAKTGAALIKAQKVDGLEGVYSSIVAAAGRIYLTGRNGVTVVIKSSNKYEVLASNTLEDGFDASPALTGRQLFLRGKAHLYCIE